MVEIESIADNEPVHVYLCQGGGNNVGLEESLYKKLQRFFSKKQKIGSPWILKKDRSQQYRDTSCLYDGKTMTLYAPYVKGVVEWEQWHLKFLMLKLDVVLAKSEKMESALADDMRAYDPGYMVQEIERTMSEATNYYKDVFRDMNIKVRCPIGTDLNVFHNRDEVKEKYKEIMRQAKAIHKQVKDKYIKHIETQPLQEKARAKPGDVIIIDGDGDESASTSDSGDNGKRKDKGKPRTPARARKTLTSTAPLYSSVQDFCLHIEKKRKLCKVIEEKELRVRTMEAAVNRAQMLLKTSKAQLKAEINKLKAIDTKLKGCQKDYDVAEFCRLIPRGQ